MEHCLNSFSQESAQNHLVETCNVHRHLDTSPALRSRRSLRSLARSRCLPFQTYFCTSLDAKNRSKISEGQCLIDFTTQNTAKKPKNAAKTTQDAAKTPQRAPRRPLDVPRRPQGAPRRPKTPQETPKTRQDGSKTPPKRRQDASKTSSKLARS